MYGRLKGSEVRVVDNRMRRFSRYIEPNPVMFLYVDSLEQCKIANILTERNGRKERYLACVKFETRVLPEFAWLTNPKHYWRTRSSELQGTTLKLGKRPRWNLGRLKIPSTRSGVAFLRDTVIWWGIRKTSYIRGVSGGWTPISRGVVFSV